jgi:hypothetical protein
MMKNIYARTDPVIVSLGESDTASEVAFSTFHGALLYSFSPLEKSAELSDKINRNQDTRWVSSTKWDPSASGEKIEEAIPAIFNREYWSRAWIVQKIMMARTVSIWCGDERTN